MATSFSQGVICAEKLAIFTSSDEVDEWQIREFFLEKWTFLSQFMDHGTILFIAGVHGTKEGKLSECADSLETMIRQFKIPKMKSIEKDMEERNIKAEFLGIHQYYKNIDTKEIDEVAVLTKIQKISPQMVVMVICYSQCLEFRFLLEEKGIFSELRMNRDLCLTSKGKILTMNQTQKGFLQNLAKPENITKREVWIEGKAGSGKTLLGIEAIKMKLAHYIRVYGFNAIQAKQQLRVIIVINHNDGYILRNQLKQELTSDIGAYSTLSIYNAIIWIGNSVENMIENRYDYKTFKHTILMIDECLVARYMDYQYKRVNQTLNIDYIYCAQYFDLGTKYSEALKSQLETKNMLCCQLLDCQRSSQEIMNLTNYIARHTPNYLMKDFPSKLSFEDSIPQWILLEDSKTFVHYVRNNWSHPNADDVMLVYENHDEEIETLCSELKWKYCFLDTISGSEASVVIVYDHDMFEYEVFTRAKNHLIIVTTQGKKFGDLAKILGKIVTGSHDKEACEKYEVLYKNTFNESPKSCKLDNQELQKFLSLTIYPKNDGLLRLFETCINNHHEIKELQERNKVLQEKLENQSPFEINNFLQEEMQMKVLDLEFDFDIAEAQLKSERLKTYEFMRKNQALLKEKIDLQQELEAIRSSEGKLKCKIAHIRTIVDEESEEYLTSQQTHKLSNLIEIPKGLKRMSFRKSK